MKLHGDAVRKRLHQACQQSFRFRFLAFRQQTPKRPSSAAGQQDQTRRMFRDHIQRELRFQPGIGVEEAA